MQKNTDGITISKFAAVCGVSRQTLIFYDRKGLFHPAYTDTKGYRYYSINQQEEFSLIHLLTELDTPLEEIKDYLQHKSPEAFLSLLDEKKNSVMTKLGKFESISRLIDERSRITREALEISDPFGIKFEDQSEENLLLSRALSRGTSDEISEVTGELENFLRTKNIETFGFGAMIKKEDLISPFRYRIANFYTKTSLPAEGSELKPAGLYAVTFHRGSYDRIDESYRRLLGFLEKKGLKIAGNAYETDLLSSYMVKSEDEYLTKITVRIGQEGQRNEASHN